MRSPTIPPTEEVKAAVTSRDTRHIIRLKVKRLLNSSDLPASSQVDLEQEVLADLLPRLSHFDSQRSCLQTFISRLVDHKLASMLRYAHAAKRDTRRNGISLNRPVADEDGRPSQWIDLISQQEVDDRCHRASHDHDMAFDVGAALESLPPDLRTLCRELGRKTVTSLARDSSKSRAAIYRQIDRVRRRFEDAGLREYLD